MSEVTISELAADEASGTPAEELAQHLINLESAAQANWVRLSDEALTPDQRLGLRETLRSIVHRLNAMLEILDARGS